MYASTVSAQGGGGREGVNTMTIRFGATALICAGTPAASSPVVFAPSVQMSTRQKRQIASLYGHENELEDILRLFVVGTPGLQTIV